MLIAAIILSLGIALLDMGIYYVTYRYGLWRNTDYHDKKERKVRRYWGPFSKGEFVEWILSGIMWFVWMFLTIVFIFDRGIGKFGMTVWGMVVCTFVLLIPAFIARHIDGM